MERKVMRIGKFDTGRSGRWRYANIYIKVDENRLNPKYSLSISGVIEPYTSGNAYGSCGQIDMEFEHRNPEDNDKRYSDHLIKASDIYFASGWNREKWFDLLDVWTKWHMKYMDAIPQSVIAFIESLPNTDKEPAWV